MRKIIFIFAAIIMALGTNLLTAQDQTADSAKATVEPQPAAEVSPLSVDAKVCSAIEDRQPAGVADRFDAGVEQLYLWSKITGAIDSTAITHIWLYEGKEIAVVELPVKSASWRTWSSKKLLPAWTGEWEARVVGPDGVTMATTRFTIVAEPSGADEDTE